MSMNSIINQMLTLMILMVLGYVLGKIKFLDETGTNTLSRLVLDVATTAHIVYALLGEGITLSGKEIITFFIIVLTCYVIYFLLALIVPIIIKAPKEDFAIYRFMTVFSNCGYMGYPVAMAVFGAESVIYVSCFVIVYCILSFSIGVKMMNPGESFNFKKLLNPVMIGTVISIILLVLGVKLPTFIASSLDSLSKLMTPLAMLIIGATLSRIPIKDVFGEWRIVPITIIKLIIIPIVIWAILRNFVKDTIMLGIATIISGMPVASAAAMMCVKYEQNATLASKTTFVTTLLTVLTIPLLVYVLF